MLDFKPQKEIVYNRFLPYKDQLDEESNKFLSEIKYSLGRLMRTNANWLVCCNTQGGAQKIGGGGGGLPLV